MDLKSIKKIINEEFDFLNNSEIQKNNDMISLLNEEMFQKQFIIDSISYMGSKIKVNNVDFSYDFNDNNINIGYSATIDYQYNDEGLKFNIYIGTMNLFEIVSNRKKIINENIEKINIKWNQIPVKIYTLDGDEIDFKGYKFEDPKIKEEFIRAYVDDLIDKTDPTPLIDDGYNSPPIY